jgi:hypothetical protein
VHLGATHHEVTSTGDEVTSASAAAQQALSQAKQTLAVAAALADALGRELSCTGAGGATVESLLSLPHLICRTVQF